jgi:hypothetical protein
MHSTEKHCHRALILVLFALNFGLIRPINGQGYTFKKEESEKIVSFDFKSYGFVKTLPISYSLRKYAPKPQKQEGQTCVGWSLGYASLSILYNKHFNTTQANLKEILAFDPVYTYSLAKDNEGKSCDSATSFYSAINQMLTIGSKRLIMPPAFMSCDENALEYQDMFSSAYKLLDVYSVNLEKAVTLQDKINLLKRILYEGNPLAFGMNIPLSFAENKATKFGSDVGLWTPQKDETYMGGHAMCLLGYNDTKFGGSFEIMNSWGSEFGDNGFMWIKYSDFIKYIDEIILIDVSKPENGTCKIGDCYNGYSISSFNSGAIYEGLMENGKPNIFGVIIWPDKSFYAGGWDNGKRNGKGLYFEHDDVYKVEFENDELISIETFGYAAKKDLNEYAIEKMELLVRKQGIDIKQKISPKIAADLNFKKIY